MARKVVDRGPCEMMPPPPACARTGLKATCTGRRPSRGFCQHRPFFTQTTVLTAKLAYLLALCGAQSISVPACVTVSLRDPVADHLDGRFEFTSQPPRSPSGASQGDAQTIWRRKAGGYGGLDFGMVDTSSSKGQVSTKSGQLQCEPPVPGLPGSILSVISSALSSQRLNECSLRDPRGGSGGGGQGHRLGAGVARPAGGVSRGGMVERGGDGRHPPGRGRRPRAGAVRTRAVGAWARDVGAVGWGEDIVRQGAGGVIAPPAVSLLDPFQAWSLNFLPFCSARLFPPSCSPGVRPTAL